MDLLSTDVKVLVVEHVCSLADLSRLRGTDRSWRGAVDLGIACWLDRQAEGIPLQPFGTAELGLAVRLVCRRPIRGRRTVSITCEVSSQQGERWWLTKESGQLPPLCEDLVALLSRVEGALGRRPPRGVLALKLVRGPQDCEVVVAPLANSTVLWLAEEILPMALGHVMRGSWESVQEMCSLLTSCQQCGHDTPSERCVEQQLWEQCGWRRVPHPELDRGSLPPWWSGVSDAVGDRGAGSGPWLQCPCGCYGNDEERCSS